MWLMGYPPLNDRRHTPLCAVQATLDVAQKAIDLSQRKQITKRQGELWEEYLKVGKDTNFSEEMCQAKHLQLQEIAHECQENCGERANNILNDLVSPL